MIVEVFSGLKDSMILWLQGIVPLHGFLFHHLNIWSQVWQRPSPVQMRTLHNISLPACMLFRAFLKTTQLHCFILNLAKTLQFPDASQTYQQLSLVLSVVFRCKICSCLWVAWPLGDAQQALSSCQPLDNKGAMQRWQLLFRSEIQSLECGHAASCL